MEEREQRMFNFKVSIEEAETIDAAAKGLGMTRSDYLRSRVLSAPSATLTANLEALLMYLIYITNRTHIAVYSVAENAEILTTDRLRTIYDDAVTAGLRYMIELPERMAKTQAQIAAQTNTAPPAAE